MSLREGVRRWSEIAKIPRIFEIFKKKLKYIEEFNSQGNHTYTLGVNRFTDMTLKEFTSTHCGSKPSRSRVANETIPTPNWNISKITINNSHSDPGTVLVILAGRFKGKRVVFLKQLPSGRLLVSGPINVSVSLPFKINSVPLRRVNQAYVNATSTKVDISGVNVEKIFDEKKMGEGEFFEAEKEEKKEIPQEKKDEDQKTVDAILFKSTEAVAHLKTYLGALFSLLFPQF